jgi:hypothetical protein
MTGSIILPPPGYVMLKLANPVGKSSKSSLLQGKKPEWSPFRLLLRLLASYTAALPYFKEPTITPLTKYRCTNG